ncbi:hypothetical protein ACSLOD_28620, partial [Escherichia coli]
EQRFLLLCISRLKSGADAELQKTMTITAAEYFDSFPDMGRKNDNAVMDSGVLSAVVTGYGEAPMPGNGEMTCYLLLHNRNG